MRFKGNKFMWEDCLPMFIPLAAHMDQLLLLEWLLWATSAFGPEELADTVVFWSWAT